MNLNLFSLKWRLFLGVLAISAFVTACKNVTPPASRTAAAQTTPAPVASTTNASPAVTVTATNVLSAQELAHKKYVHDTIDRLFSLQMNNDPASLAAILKEMKNSDKTVRAAALKATIEFNDRSVIPSLQKIADETADPYEKVEILNAIDYIKLPSLTEVMAYKRSLKAAQHSTNAPAASPAATNPPSATVHP